MQADIAAGRSGFADFTPPVISGKPRAALWFILLAITAVLILYPATLKYEYSIHAVPFLYIFDNLSVFTAVYYIWLVLIFVLLFSGGGGRRTDWEKAALVGIFALVFTGYSSFMSRGLMGDAFVPAGDIKNLAAQGQFRSAPALKYNGFPGISLLGTAVCMITGMDTTDYIAFFPFLQVLVFSMIIYLFLNKLLNNSYFASLGAILMIEVDLSVSTSLPQFHAGVFAPFILLAAALLLISERRSDGSRRVFRLEAREALILIMVAALYISHFITSLVALLTILGIYIIQKISRRRILSAQLVVVLVSVPLIWNLVENLSILKYFAAMVPRAFEVFSSGEIFKNWLLPMQTNTFVGERALWWTVPSVILGPLLLMVVGGVLGLAGLVKIRRLGAGEVISLAGLAAIVILGLVLLWLGGIQEAYGRGMVYIGFFTVPLILWWLYRLKNSRKYVFSLLVAVLFLVSLPSFLSSSKGIASMTYYPREVAAGEFLEAGFGRGPGMHVFGVGSSAYYVTYYLPDAYMNAAYAPDFRSKNEEDIWRGVNEYVSSFEKIGSGGTGKTAGPGVIMFSPKWDTPFRDYTGTEVKNSAEWRWLEFRLAENDLIYSNTFVRIYYLSP